MKLSILSEAVTGDGVAYSVTSAWEVEKKDRRRLVLRRGVVVHDLRGQGVGNTIRGTLKDAADDGRNMVERKREAVSQVLRLINGGESLAWNFQVI